MQFKIFKKTNKNKKTGKAFTSYSTIMKIEDKEQYVNLSFKYAEVEKLITDSGIIEVDKSGLNLVYKDEKYRLYINAEIVKFEAFKNMSVTEDMFVMNEKETAEKEITIDGLPF